MFIALSRLISLVSRPKHNLFTSRRSLLLVFPLVAEPARQSAQWFGKSWAGSDGVWRRTRHTLRYPSKYFVFIFFQIGMFIALSRFISPVSCLKHTPVYSTQTVENAPNFIARGAVGRYMRITFACISAGGRTTSAVGSMVWEKLGGLRRSLVQVTAHTAIFIKKYFVFISSK